MKCGKKLYPWDSVQLVVLVAHVKKTDENKRFVSVVVTPAGDTGRNGDNITFPDASDLLVTVELIKALLLALLAHLSLSAYNLLPAALLTLRLSLLFNRLFGFFVSLGTAGENHS